KPTSAQSIQPWLAQEPPNLDKAPQTLTPKQADAHRPPYLIAPKPRQTQGAAPQRPALDHNPAVVEKLAQSRSQHDQHSVAVALQ
ncbi:two-component sensor histidine kinase, partial [Stenotrophomonas maltophilia]